MEVPKVRILHSQWVHGGRPLPTVGLRTLLPVILGPSVISKGRTFALVVLACVAALVPLSARFRTHTKARATAERSPDRDIRAPPEFVKQAEWIEPALNGRTPISLSSDAPAGSEDSGANYYGALLQVRDALTGAPVRVGRGVWGLGPSYRFLDEDIARSVEDIGYPPFPAWVTIDPSTLDYRDNRLLLFSTHKPYPRLGPLLYEISIPGYQPIYSDRIYLEPVIDGQVPIVELYTWSTTDAWGTLRTTWSHKGPIEHASFDSKRQVGEVYLFDAGSSPPASVGYLIVHLPLEDEHFGEIPAATYLAQFRSSDWPYEYPTAGHPMLVIDVHPGKEASVTLSAEGTGILQIDPSDDVRSGVWKIVAQNPRRTSEWLTQGRRPFSMCFMQAGSYTAQMTARNGIHLEAEPIDVVVGENEVSTWPYPRAVR